MNEFIKNILIYIVDKVSPLLPDRLCLEIQFRVRMGEKLHIASPKSFSEKLQWLKLYDRRPEYAMMVDKYTVKQYVADKIGEEYVIPTLGVWNRPEEIKWDILPKQIVLKTTHDGGSAGVIVCKSKEDLNIKEVNRRLLKSLKHSIFKTFREWPYKNVTPRIIAEKYMEQEDGSDLVDYKFFCFNGVPQFLYVRKTGPNPSLNFVTMDWEKAPFRRSDNCPAEELPDKPMSFETMNAVAKRLSEGLPFVRVDLYEINKRVYFSELTFYPSSGLLPFVPQEWDYKLGDLLSLPIKVQMQ